MRCFDWKRMLMLACMITSVHCGVEGEDGFTSEDMSASEGGDITMKGSGGALSLALAAMPTSEGSGGATGDKRSEALSPSAVNLKFYKVAVSTSDDCSSLVTLCSASSPSYQDFTKDPTFCSGALASAEYKCVVIEISDQVKFTAGGNTENGGCVQNQEYTLDVCRDSQISTLIDGTNVVCAAGEDKVAMYLSTLASTSGDSHAATDGNPFIAPTSSTRQNGFKLQTPWQITGITTGTFVADFSEGLIEKDDGNSVYSCELQPPSWDFK